jgi:hypothetical protein
MCKILRLVIFYYKVITYIYIFLGLGSEFETDQAF